jgi:hypothetical protein
MRLLAVALALCMASSSAFAWGKKEKEDHDKDHEPKVTVPVTSNTTAVSSSAANAAANQNQKQTQSQTTSSTSGAVAANSGNNTNINNPRQTPFAYSPEALPTAPCFKGYSAGASSPLIAGSFGGGKIDKGCEARETARSFALLGNQQAAAKLLCSTEAAKRAHLTIEDCMNVREDAPAGPTTSVEVQVTPTFVQPSPVATPSTPVAPNVAARVKARKKLHRCPVEKSTVVDQHTFQEAK